MDATNIRTNTVRGGISILKYVRVGSHIGKICYTVGLLGSWDCHESSRYPIGIRLRLSVSGFWDSVLSVGYCYAAGSINKLDGSACKHSGGIADSRDSGTV